MSKEITEEQIAKLNAVQDMGAITFRDPRIVKKHVKQCRSWRFEVPEYESDLVFQIYFKDRYSDLVVNKRISKLITALEKGLGESDLPGAYDIDAVPESRCVVITSKNFWKNFAADPDKLSNIIEKACDATLP